MSETMPLVLGNVTKPGAVDRLQRAGQAAVQVLGATASMRVGDVIDDDIVSVEVDLSGVRFESLEEFERAGERIEEVLTAHGIGEERLDAVHASQGLLRFAEVRARPLIVMGAEFTLDGALADVPITWLEDAAGRLAIAIDDRRDPLNITGDLALRVPQDAFIELLHRVVAELDASEDVPFNIDLRQVRLTQETPRSVKVEASAKVSKGIVGGTAIGRATIEIDHDLVLHVRELEVTSRNPIIAGLLKFADSYMHVDPVELADIGPLGERIIDVTLTVGDEIEARAILGDPH